MRRGISFSEVLITLGIIGIVVALTIPQIITKYQKHLVETKVARFYSLINQALRIALLEQETPEAPENIEFNRYFSPYMRIVKQWNCSSYTIHISGLCSQMPDHSVILYAKNSGTVGMWYITDGNMNKLTTRNTFSFELLSTNSRLTQSKYTVEPHLFAWNGKYENLIKDTSRGCNNNSYFLAYCTQLLKLNNWKIPNDYLW